MTSYDRRSVSKQAAAGGPDPLTYKAFLSEYENGVKRGVGQVTQHPGFDQEARTDAETELVAAAKIIEDLMQRLIQQAGHGHGTTKIRPQRFATKVSQQMSTIFYNCGLLEGLSK